MAAASRVTKMVKPRMRRFTITHDGGTPTPLFTSTGIACFLAMRDSHP